MAARQIRPLLEDMLAYAEEAIALIGERAGNALAHDRIRFLAVSRTIEIVGEAAAKVPTEKRAALPAIDFQSAAAMRNRLVHGYGSVDPDILVNTVRQDFPTLVATLKAALAGPLPDEAESS